MRSHDDSDFTFHATHGTDDFSFILCASCDPDDSSHRLLIGAHLASAHPTGASHAASQCDPRLSRGSSASDVDLKGCQLLKT
jgi:hypothetical protein